jgi:hypothetical protein
MTLLTGYAAWAEADVGNVKLFALTPELTDEPTYRNAGTDPLRQDWRVPSEQIACEVTDGAALLKGTSFTKWIVTEHTTDQTLVHTRQLEVAMTYEAGEMVLAYRTLSNRHPQPLPSRLLLLLIARPLDQPGTLTVTHDEGTLRWATPPAADHDAEFHIDAPVGTVRFTAADGSGIEIIPEQTRAVRVTAERPSAASVPKRDRDGSPKDSSINTKPANEGSLRLAFEGEDALEQGRFRLRFLRAQRA